MGIASRFRAALNPRSLYNRFSKHIGNSVSRSIDRVKAEYLDFQGWWNDPIGQSERKDYRHLDISPAELYELEHDALGFRRSATTPAKSSAQRLRKTSAAPSDISLGPLLSSGGTLASPEPVIVGDSFPGDTAHTHDTVQRHPFDRRPSHV